MKNKNKNSATLAKSGMSPLSIPTFYKQNKNKNNSSGLKIKPLDDKG